jgi:group I intron endonuclease
MRIIIYIRIMSQDFSKAKIYKITNDYNDEVYIGSTCDTLNKRLSKHKGDANDTNKNKNRLFYKLMNEIGFERFRIDLIENYPCEDRYALRQREGYWIRQLGTLNLKIAGRESEEYHKDYYEKNKNKILEYHKNYHENNKTKILEYHKKYNEENKEMIKDKKRQYYQETKEIQAEKAKQDITCECGCAVRIYKISRHRQTKKHIELMKEKEEK